MWAFLSMAVISFALNLSEVRTLYQEALDDSDKADKLVSTTKGSTQAIYKAYYGAGLAFQAKHSWNPATKLSKASDAATQLNAAVKAAPSDLEVRFLRFAFESSVPSMLSLSEHVAEDKKWILANKNTSHAMWSVMKKFLKGCSALTEAEKKTL